MELIYYLYQFWQYTVIFYHFYNLQRTEFITLRYGDFPDVVNSLQVYRPPRCIIFTRDGAAATHFHGRVWIAIDGEGWAATAAHTGLERRSA